MATPPKTGTLKTLADIAHLLQTSRPDDKPLDHIVRQVRRTLKVDVCSLYLLHDSKLILVATDGLDLNAIGRVKMPLQKGLVGLVAETLEPVVVKEAQSHPRFEYFPKTREERYESFAGVPLIERQQMVGVLTIQTKTVRTFTEEPVAMLSLIAYQLAPVIRNLVTLEIFRKKTKKKKPASLKLSGTGASPGFVVGPTIILQTKLGTIIPTTIKQAPTIEVRRFREAVREADQDLADLEKKLMKKPTQKESDIFTAHRMILKDRTFQQKVKKEIQKKKTAEQAVIKIIEQYLKTFAQIKDPYLRERASDVQDLGQRLLSKLQAIESPLKNLQQEGILIADRLTPSETALLDPEHIQGIVTVHGGHTSHAAILARSLGIPAIMGVSEKDLKKISSGQLAIVDGNSGNLFINPPRQVLQEYERIQEKYADRLVQLNTLADLPSETKDGRQVHLDANVGLINSMNYLGRYGAEGVGLYRTEFPFMIREKLPNEQEQFQVYRRILEGADGLPVTFRTLDAGGDKPISYLHLDDDASFLGYRSIRLCLGEPQILKTQLKALFRVSEYGRMHILFPMISGLEELRQVKKLISEVRRELKKRKKLPSQSARVPIGIMIEVPSAVHLAHLLIKEVDFFSVGTNDLIQYTLAVDRNNERVADFFEPFHPAVIYSLWKVVQAAHQEGKWVSICGEMAGDPLMTPLLVALGFDRLSMIPANIPVVKKIIRSLKYSNLLKDMKKLLDLPTANQIRKRLARYQPRTTYP